MYVFCCQYEWIFLLHFFCSSTFQFKFPDLSILYMYKYRKTCSIWVNSYIVKAHTHIDCWYLIPNYNIKRLNLQVDLLGSIYTYIRNYNEHVIRVILAIHYFYIQQNDIFFILFKIRRKMLMNVLKKQVNMSDR